MSGDRTRPKFIVRELLPPINGTTQHSVLAVQRYEVYSNKNLEDTSSISGITFMYQARFFVQTIVNSASMCISVLEL